MQKICFASMSCALLMSAAAIPAFAEDTSSIFVSTCAEWKSSIPMDTEALDKLKKNSINEKPASGLSQTKEQFVVLLGKNLVAAKDTLANFKNKLPKTREGKTDLTNVSLNGFNLSGLNLDNVDFKGSELNGADLSGSTLRGASLYKTELESANLNNTDLSFANASKAKLVNASLCHATLTSTDLEDSILRGAYMKGAKLDMARNVPKMIYLNAESVLHFGLSVPPEN